MNYHPSMSDLYRRLSAAGLDRPFLLQAVLPKWWEDSLATVPANRELAELYLARNLSFRMQDLRNPAVGLELPLRQTRFKRPKKSEPDRVRPAAFLAQQAADIIAASVQLPPFRALTRVEARQWILQKFGRIDLRGLLEFCWAHGIVVFHLAKAPKNSHKFDGLAMYSGSTPIIMLGSNRRQASWLAFHLAHEIAHILLGHVVPGGELLVDSSLETNADRDAQEDEANRLALFMLCETETPKLSIASRLAPKSLVKHVNELGRQLGVDPGILCLVFGDQNKTWSLAGAALKLLDEGESVSATINDKLRSRIDWKEVPESHRRLLEAVLA